MLYGGSYAATAARLSQEVGPASVQVHVQLDICAVLRAAAANTNVAAAPALSERERRGPDSPGGGRGGLPGGGPSLPKVLWNRTLRQLSSLPLAIGELAVIAVLSSLGTIIEQGKPLEFYMEARVVAIPA